MGWYRNIVRSGLNTTDEYQEKRAILLSNYISLVLCGCLLLLFVIRRFVFGHISGGINLEFLSVGIVLFVAPILLNRLERTTASRLLLCYAPVFFIWYVFILQLTDMPRVEQAAYDSMRIYLLAVSSIPYLLLNEKKKNDFLHLKSENGRLTVKQFLIFQSLRPLIIIYKKETVIQYQFRIVSDLEKDVTSVCFSKYC